MLRARLSSMRAVLLGARRPARALAPRMRGVSTAAGAQPHQEAGKMYAQVTRRGKDREPQALNVGDKLHGFTVVSTQPVPEFNLLAVRLVHGATGAQHVHLDSEDTNNVFSVMFRTPPSDSTGVPHILEHTVLCGSRHYPVRDPFFNMLKRSLNTFMNAMTASEFTMYPFATQVPADYAHLLAVYTDAAFFPNLDRFDFMQEGHRLELAKSAAGEQELEFKGVVYNEMKGTLSDRGVLFGTRVQQLALPGTTYAHDSGGDPAHIPDLTWEQLRAFHRRHYHPSNALFYTYGDLPLRCHLAFLDQHVLRQFSRDESSASTAVERVQPFDAPRQHSVTCAPDPLAADPARQHRLVRAQLAGSSKDHYSGLALRLLSTLLMHGAGSPLYKALIASGLGTAYADAGYDSSTLDATFRVGVMGLTEAGLRRAEADIDAALRRAAEEGFDQDRVAAALHQIELGLKHTRGDFGLSLMYGVGYTWAHGGSVEEGLHVQQLLDRLKADLSNPEFLPGLIRRHLLSNPHTVTVTMSPDPEHEARALRQERARLADIRARASEGDLKRVQQEAEELAQRQNAPPNVHCLPTLQRDHIPRRAIVHPADHGVLRVAGGTNEPAYALQRCEQPTNGLVYLRLKFDLTDTPADLWQYVPLFTSALPQLGAGAVDYNDIEAHIERSTGGIDASACVSADLHDSQRVSQALLVSTHCLQERLPRALEVLGDVLTDTHWHAVERLEQLIASRATSLAEGLARRGHRYAMTRASSGLSPAAQLLETLGGTTQAQVMQQLAAEGRAGAERASEALRTIAAAVLRRKPGSRRREEGSDMQRFYSVEDTGVACSVVALEQALADCEGPLSGLLNRLPLVQGAAGATAGPWRGRVTKEAAKLFLGAPVSVNFAAQALPSAAWAHGDSPHLSVLAQIMSSCFLHREIREKGGAYGSGALDADGIFRFFSFYDPQTTQTLEAFRASMEWATAGGFSDTDVMEALLSVFGSLDAPKGPASVNMHQFLLGVSDDQRQARREAYLNTSKERLVQVAREYLAKDARAASSLCVIGPQSSTHLQAAHGWDRRVLGLASAPVGGDEGDDASEAEEAVVGEGRAGAGSV